MLLKDFLPAPDVREFIQLYRIVHLQFPAGQTIPVKAYPPRPEQCLAFYPYDTETVEYANSGKKISHLRTVLYGQFSEVTNRIIGNRFLVFQIVFWPGALYRLLGMPSAEITNQYLDATLVFKDDVKLVNEQLAHATDYLQMLHIADAFVRQLIRRKCKPLLPIDEACSIMLAGNNRLTLQQLASQACLSPRQLERRFKERTGVNPKLFERIIRFDKVFRLKNSKPDMDWLSIALECNYHDYQHLVKEYIDFTGFSPNKFHSIENNAPERRFGLSEGYYKD